jgi:hypothetical protein
MNKWLLVFSLIMMSLNAGFAYTEDVFLAESIAPPLAVRFGVEEAFMRKLIKNTCHETWEGRLIVFSGPWLLMCCLLAVSEFTRANRHREGD